MALTKVNRGGLNTGISDGSNATAITIDSSERVGIGATSMDEMLLIQQTASGANTDVTIRSANDGNSRINFGDQSSDGSGRVDYDHTSNYMAITTNSSERMRIDSSGNVGIGMTPSRPLHIQASSGAASIYVRGRSSDGTATMLLHEDNSGNAQNSITGYTTHLRLDAGTTSDGGHNMQFHVNDVERMRIDSNGFFGVGIASPNASLHVEGTSTNDNLGATYINNQNSADNACVASFATAASGTSTSNVILRFGSNNYAAGQGMIVANGGGAVTFASFSDRALKENIADLPLQLDKILALRPVEFDYIEDQGGGHQIGFIAQEVEEIYPDLVGENEDGIKMLGGFDKTTARLVKALQEAVAKIEALETRVAALEAGQ